MTEATLKPSSQTPNTQRLAGVLQEMAIATKKQATAWWTTLTHRAHPGPLTSARQEADTLREYADQLYRTDPRYAHDLYAAATRHELAATAT
ncbi:hypothetical protein LHU53_08590 [Rhodoferax sp. U2-2l]|uniref:hypothetical protein n=1 Tax=Rhodoferax sp. U2-2l TaxID=2884000 RepID=UPI001D09DCE4|nr:hypothetical protein [Rhodoferax sp. U2-2l]MCB8746962.1 hypothetical protein [Rhodoferax sp. U2-2l]